MRLVLSLLLLLTAFSDRVGAQVAGSPLNCRANAGVPPVLRAEGFTELVGDIVITCEGGDPAAPFTANFQMSLNTNITSRIVSASPELTEALLMIDEPGLDRLNSSGVLGTPTPFCLSPSPDANGSTPAANCNPIRAGETYQQGVHTVFRATRVTGQPSAVAWAGVRFVPPGRDRQRILRLTNIRANAAAIGRSVTLIPSTVNALVTVSQGTLPIEGPQQVVGYVQQSVVVDVRSCSGQPIGSGSVQKQCSPTEAQRLFHADPTRAGELPAVGTIRFREGFQTAFETQMISGQASSIPGVVYNSESGFVQPAAGIAGIADTGTRLVARFTNVPAGVRLFVATRQSSGSGTSTAVLVSGDANGAPPLGTPSASRPLPVAPSAPGAIRCGSEAVPAVEVPLTSGAGQAVWEVTSGDPSANQTLLFPFAVAYSGEAPGGPPPVGTALVEDGIGPSYPVTDTATTMQGVSVAVPRFGARLLPALPLFHIGSCTPGPVVVAFNSNPVSASVMIDNVEHRTPVSFSWEPGEVHAIDALAVQFGASGRIRFASWSNGGTQQQSLTVPSMPLTLTASYTTQYYVGGGSGLGGTVGISPSLPERYYDSGAEVVLTATPDPGYSFAGWTGDLAGQTASRVRLKVVRGLNPVAVFVASPCATTLGERSVFPPAEGVAATISVSRAAQCGAWTAVSSHPWVRIAGPATGTGNGSVRLQAEPNPGTRRQATVTVGGSTVVVNQAGSCALALPTSVLPTAPAGDSTGMVQFTSTVPGCAWEASSDSSWVQVFPLSGAGNGTVSYTVFPNFTSPSRFATVTIGGQQIRITQQAGLGTSDARFIRLLYFNYFGRLPSDAEVAFQLGSGATRHQLAQGFLNSAEFNNGGRFVAGLYVGLLDRDAEYGGWLFQRNALSRGFTTAESVVSNFLNGGEFAAKFGTLTNAQFTSLLYRQILGREATAAEVVWRSDLLANGLTRVTMARDLLSSTEFRQGKNARLLSFLLYATLLNRDPAAEESQQRRAQIAADPSDAGILGLLREIVESPEMGTQIL